MMLRVVELGIELIGRDDATDLPIERVKVGQVLRCASEHEPPDPANPNASYRAGARDDETIRAGDLACRRRRLPGRSAARADPAQRPVHQHRRRQPPDLVRRVRRALPDGRGARPAGASVVPGRQRGADTATPLPTPVALARYALRSAGRSSFPSSLPGAHPRAPLVHRPRRPRGTADEDEKSREAKQRRGRRHSHRVHRDFLLGLGRRSSGCWRTCRPT